MKKVKITAFNGTGKEKVLAGEREVDMPDTPEEAVKLFGLEDTMDYITSSRTIEVQRQIRAGTTETAKSQLAKLLAFAAANPDSDVAKTLVELKIGQKAEVANENPPEAPKEEPKVETPQAPVAKAPARSKK